MKILILRFSSIGDIVLTTPVLRCLKMQLPGAELHYCTKRAFAEIIEPNPYIDRRHYLDGSLNDLIRQLRAERYDLIIDLHNNLRTRIIKTRLGVRARTVDKLNWQKWLYVRWKIDRLPNRHIVDRYMDTVLSLGVVNDGRGLDHFISPTDRIAAHELPPSHQTGYVAYAIGGQHATKRLPVTRIIDLCRQLDQPVVLLGDAQDRETGGQVVQALGPARIYNACGLYRLNQSASLVAGARLVISHDTGLMHVAAALRKTICVIWGNTTPRFGMYPYQTTFTSLEKTGLPCRPCSKIGADRCPLGHFRCMNEVGLAVPEWLLAREGIG